MFENEASSRGGVYQPFSIKVTVISVLLLILTAGSATIAIADTAVSGRRASTRHCRGIRVTPNTNLQRRIQRSSARSTFCFARGRYRLSSTVQTEEKFPILDLRAGAIIDGGNGDFAGITGTESPAGTSGMRILGGVFENFGNASAPTWVSPVMLHDNAVVVGSEFRQNFNVGIAIRGDHVRISKVHTHHNGRYGLDVSASCDGCSGPDGVVIENSEIAFNNTRKLATNGDAGGTKFVGTDGMIVRRNRVHHNYGSGLWWDGLNTNAHVYGNVIHDNYRWGIRWEVSYGGLVAHDNELTNNGVGDGTIFNYSNGQIVIANSDGSNGAIEIYDNRVAGIAHAITIDDNAERSIQTKHVLVHDNTIILRGDNSRVGAVASSGTELFSESWDNHFEDNRYRVRDLTGRYWVWNGETLTWAEWRAYGHDEGGIRRTLG